MKIGHWIAVVIGVSGLNSMGYSDSPVHDESGHSHVQDGKGTEEFHEEAEHEHEEDHGHEERNEKVGPDKGILEADEKKGIRLSEVAARNLGIKTQLLSGKGPWSLPVSARFESAEERNLFRLRNGFYRRVDYSQISKTDSLIVVKSSDLKEGDSIVVQGVGYLRIAEITAFGGAPEGHSH